MLRTLVSNGFIAAGWIAVGIVFVLLFFLYRREAKAHRTAQNSPRTELTNMTILLQTMRDMLDKQKALAREFNKSLDHKVTIIRKVVRAVTDERERLNKTHQELTQMMTAAKADLARIRAHATAIKANQTAAPSQTPIPGPKESTSPSRPARTPQVRVDQPLVTEQSPTLQVLAQPANPDSDGDLIDTWVGLDFGGDEPNPYAFEVPEVVPDVAEDPETAREAFRKLLNLSEEPAQDQSPALAPGKTNGRSRSGTLRARVLEYSDAGMSVPEIARELGLGKGEVRLILSIGAKEAKHRGQRKHGTVQG